MKRISLILVAAVLLQSLVAFPALAVQRKHKPWLSRKASPKQVASRPVKAPVVPVVSRRRGVDVIGDQIAKQARSYKGTRYRYGGTSKRGLDCSGLVARVWADLKMKKIPRASASLYNTGERVRLAELQPGDLVFFKNTYKRGISHVGVYTGKNKFVHAAGDNKGVTITKLSDPYYQLHYAGARRLY